MPNYLTWQQLQNRINVPDAISIVDGQVMLNVSLITGDNLAALTDEGVIEFTFKFLGYCYQTQEALNNTTPVGQRLASFSSTSYGTPTEAGDGQFQTVGNRSISAIIPLDTDSIIGTNR